MTRLLAKYVPRRLSYFSFLVLLCYSSVVAREGPQIVFYSKNKKQIVCATSQRHFSFREALAKIYVWINFKLYQFAMLSHICIFIYVLHMGVYDVLFLFCSVSVVILFEWCLSGNYHQSAFPYAHFIQFQCPSSRVVLQLHVNIVSSVTLLSRYREEEGKILGNCILIFNP